MGHFRFRKLGIWCHTPHQGLLMSLLFMKPFSMSQHVVRSTWTDKSWHIIHSSLVFCTLLCGSSQTLAPYFYFFSQQWFILCLKWFTWNFSIVFYPFNCSWTTIDIHMSQSISNNSYTWPHASCRWRKYLDRWLIPPTYTTINHAEYLHPFLSLLKSLLLSKGYI